MTSHDVVARRAAADELYGLGTAVVPPMIEALRCRWVAFAPVRDALAGARTERERRTFAGVFSDLGESALPDFIDALKDPRREIRLGAIWGIARLQEAGFRAASTIAAMLGGADQRIDKAATHALISIGPAVVPMLRLTGRISAKVAQTNHWTNPASKAALLQFCRTMGLEVATAQNIHEYAMCSRASAGASIVGGETEVREEKCVRHIVSRSRSPACWHCCLPFIRARRLLNRPL